MTKEELEFIRRLNREDLVIIQNILNQDKDDVLKYINLELNKMKISDTMEELTKDIPITYLPVIGASLDYYHKFGYFKSIYDYQQKSEKEKKQVRNLGNVKIRTIDYAVDFTLKHLQETIKFYEQSGVPIISGRALLDEDLREKEELIIKQISDIYDYFLKFGNEYVFFGTSKDNCLEFLVDENNKDKKRKLIEILARYSSLEDLQDYNIMSFQKFIRK